MKMGITGTRNGATTAQSVVLISVLFEMEPEEVHHGNCVGVDDLFVTLARDLVDDVIIVSHPPKDAKLESRFQSDIVLPRQDYLDRNKSIVDSVDYMVGVPSGSREALRSGTWATIRYAKKVGRPLMVVYPDGSKEFYG